MKVKLMDVKEFTEVEIYNQKAIVTDERIIYPLDNYKYSKYVYAYDVRHDDVNDPDTIEPHNSVLVDFWGTLITYKPIDLGKNDYLNIKHDDVDFLGELENINPYEYAYKLFCADTHSSEVLKFIDNFIKEVAMNSIDTERALENVFMGGYCYHFAHMLKAAFNRGEVYICAPYGHVVWRDIDNVYYDFNGIYENGDAVFVPVTDPESHWQDFARSSISNEGATEEDIEKLILKYRNKFPNM